MISHNTIRDCRFLIQIQCPNTLQCYSWIRTVGQERYKVLNGCSKSVSKEEPSGGVVSPEWWKELPAEEGEWMGGKLVLNNQPMSQKTFWYGEWTEMGEGSVLNQGTTVTMHCLLSKEDGHDKCLLKMLRQQSPNKLYVRFMAEGWKGQSWMMWQQSLKTSCWRRERGRNYVFLQW